MTQEQKTAEDKAHWDKWFVKYHDRLQKEAESVSDLETASQERTQLMNQTNPK